MRGDVIIRKVLFRIAIFVIVLCICGTAVFAVYVYTETKKGNEVTFFWDKKGHTSTSNKTQKLDQILFVGDSITQGYSAYNKLPTHQLIFLKGLSAEYMFDTKMYHINQYDKLDVFLKDIQPKYVYVGFGMNDLSKTPYEFISMYEERIKKIRELCPKSVIGLVSITPVRDNGSITNKKVEAFNAEIKKLAQKIGEPQCYYINIHDSLLDEKREKVSTEYGAGDGVHLNASAYDVILDYIRKNPIN